jgi:hypothetical protein
LHSKFTPLPLGGRGLDVVNPEMMLKKLIIKGARVKKKNKMNPQKKEPSRDPTRTMEGQKRHGKVDCQSTP